MHTCFLPYNNNNNNNYNILLIDQTNTIFNCAAAKQGAHMLTDQKEAWVSSVSPAERWKRPFWNVIFVQCMAEVMCMATENQPWMQSF